MRKQSQFPPGWDEARVRRVLEHYEAQSDEEAVAEDEASFEATTHTLRWMFRLISCPPFASLSPSTSVAPDPPMQTARSPLSLQATRGSWGAPPARTQIFAPSPPYGIARRSFSPAIASQS